jgi:2OG-Fe(II) oxygenase superfamily
MTTQFSGATAAFAGLASVSNRAFGGVLRGRLVEDQTLRTGRGRVDARRWITSDEHTPGVFREHLSGAQLAVTARRGNGHLGLERPRVRYDPRAMGKRTPARIAERLQAVFERIDRPGAFCVRGALGVVLPGLEVEGMGSIGLPLTAAQARALRRRCEQAPYGKGTQTLVDTRVRRVWRLAPSRFALTNPAWPEFLGVAVARVQAELGLERQRLTAHLHDLLLYEEGCFFKAHRDGEKRDRMVATLVITLPAVHGGGELVVRHEGQEQIVDFSRPEGRHQIQFAAFYADCEHEVKPLRSGHRLCLVYNLALAKSRAPLGPP